MSDSSIKCACSHCGAKYRLPIEAAGRSARCKRCGKPFEVPKGDTLEDSILSWLSGPTEEDADDTVSGPRIISMPTDQGEANARRAKGVIRMKSADAAKEEKAR